VPSPYGHFSTQRPGATAYDITIVQPLDLSGKHKTNKRVAEMSIPVLEAHYQDAVRLEIDRLFTVFVHVLAARAEVRAARDNLKILSEAAQQCDEQDRKRISVRRAKAHVAVRQAEALLLHARRTLSVLLAIPAEEADHLHICGSLRDRGPPPPSTGELIAMARQARPDLRALQLSVDRARAEVRREKAEALDDFFLFFTPYQAVDMTPQGKQIANSWEIGVMIPIPSLNRNQGEIQRARVNVTQWRMEMERTEQEIIDEVRRAAAEYMVSRQIVEQYERDILAPVHRRREETHHRFLEEHKDVAAFLAAQRDYDETIHAYLEGLARHRRAMLHLNTVVGQRILP
jgi:cobalt-zinc-cadmium efflux system outer membrane protein